jgi:hypothetical protein
LLDGLLVALGTSVAVGISVGTNVSVGRTVIVSVGSGVAVSAGIGVDVSAGMAVRVGGIVVGTGVIDGAVVSVAGTVLVATGVGIVVFVGVAVLGSTVFGAAAAVCVKYSFTLSFSTHKSFHTVSLSFRHDFPVNGLYIGCDGFPVHAPTNRAIPKSWIKMRNDMVSPVDLHGFTDTFVTFISRL